MTPMDEESRVRCIRAFESLVRPIARLQTIRDLLTHGDSEDIIKIRAEIVALKDWMTHLDAAAERLAAERLK